MLGKNQSASSPQPTAKTAERLTTQQIRHLIETGDDPQRALLATRPELSSRHQRTLSKDRNAEVRRALLLNPSLASDIAIALSSDEDAVIRQAVPEALIRRLSAQATREPTRTDKMLIRALGILAEDELGAVRREVSRCLLLHDCRLSELLALLAKDLDRQVSEPVILHAAGLEDGPLEELIQAYPPEWMLKAIAERRADGAKPYEPEAVTRTAAEEPMILDSDFVIDGEAEPYRAAAVPAVVPGAAVDTNKPDPEKSLELAANLAFQSGKRVLGLLKQAVHVDPDGAKKLAARAAHSLERVRFRGLNITALRETQQRQKAGDLTDQWLVDQLAGPDGEDWAIAALSITGEVHPVVVKRVLDSRNPRAITALCWHAGFAMRSAMEIQQRIARIPHRQVLLPRNGVGYPLTARAMRWYLEFFGIEPKRGEDAQPLSKEMLR